MSRVSVELDTKPSDHFCLCGICRKPISKGEKRLMVRCEAYHADAVLYYHPNCFLSAIKDMVEAGEGCLNE